MKKILAALLAAMMILTMVAVPTFADGENTTFTASKATAFANNEVVYTIDVANNAGMTGVTITVCYDKDVFTYKNESAVAGNIFGSAPQVGDVSDGCQFVYADATANTNNGTLITLTFEVSENAATGEYPVELIVRECIDANSKQLPTSVVAGSITVVEPKAEISEWGITLDESVTVDYYATIDAPFAGAQMQFTMNGYTLDPVDGTLVEDNVYVYSFNGVAPHRMGDDITAELVYNNDVKDSKTTSVAAYCEAVVGTPAAELGLSAKKFAALETLVANLLEYGATAQVYNDYKTNALVSEIDLSDWVELTEDDVFDFFYYENGDDGFQFTSAQMLFKDTNSLFVKVDMTAVADYPYWQLSIVNDVTGDEVIYIDYTFAAEDLAEIANLTIDGDTYIIEIKDLYANAIEDTYSMEIKTSTNGRRWNAYQFVTYSTIAYVYAMQNSANTAMADLAKALYNYGYSAMDYAAA